MLKLLVWLIAVIGATQMAVVFVVDMAPGEGLKSYEAAGAILELKAHPSTDAFSIDRIELRRGTRLAHDSVRYQTVAPGLRVATAATQLVGRRLGDRQAFTRAEYYRGRFARDAASVPPGDTVMMLQARAESACFVRYQGEVWDADPCPGGPADTPGAFAATSEPVTEWWIRTTVHDVTGWVLVTDSTVVVRVSF